jgi:hypothetical protein
MTDPTSDESKTRLALFGARAEDEAAASAGHPALISRRDRHAAVTPTTSDVARPAPAARRKIGWFGRLALVASGMGVAAGGVTAWVAWRAWRSSPVRAARALFRFGWAGWRRYRKVRAWLRRRTE